MSTASARIESLARLLDDAVLEARLVPMLTQQGGQALSLEDAYAVQLALIGRRQKRGERVVGMKMGLTSRAKMRQMGVDTPIYGHLTDRMQVEDGGVIPVSRLCHPRIEPEIAFLLKADLRGPVTAAQALAAVAGVCPALEIVDSRYQDFRFALEDVVADNASAAYFVLGSTLTGVEGLRMDCLGMVMQVNGVVVETGSSAAVYDHPARSLAEQANMLARHGKSLSAGQIVLSGGATAAVELHRGDTVTVSIDGLGMAWCRAR